MYESIGALNSELVNTQRQLAKANARLTAANDLKNKLFGVLAHDLRTPLSVISGYSQILELLLPTATTGQEMEFVGRIQQSVGYMLALIEDILSLSAIETGHLTINRQPADMTLLAQRIVSMASILADQKSITLSATSSRPLWVLMDRVKIEQVLTNLIGNAIKFSHPGSTITIALSAEQDEEGQPWARMEVTDTGIGIAPQKLESLFHPFAEGSQGTAGESSIGLGLYICARVIEAHGGSIHVASAQGEGTTVSVVLPAEG
ncbi:Sensory transduction histidine kinase [Paramagnetospirillum magnetotacticum MS-1]|uniref:histidine kinase n=1 Tax=Paramagnetospirillum magnetotacticum MS-1 TaxID=272627 RepID=A0A0C2YVY4_PARME|nr:HAMP domain-containing sensor histidine kinase [Paramagnetospirillum magnetotacticum]KIL99278.1 Sensory transduction histidine kinase [Paramagnetospirillum magnetotacticum MS-1]